MRWTINELINSVKQDIKTLEEGDSFIIKEYIDRDKKIIEALEKQTAKKPYLESDICEIWVCPTCGMKYELYFEKFKYCLSCGQLMDWSVEE